MIDIIYSDVCVCCSYVSSVRHGRERHLRRQREWHVSIFCKNATVIVNVV